MKRKWTTEEAAIAANALSAVTEPGTKHFRDTACVLQAAGFKRSVSAVSSFYQQKVKPTKIVTIQECRDAAAETDRLVAEIVKAYQVVETQLACVKQLGSSGNASKPSVEEWVQTMSRSHSVAQQWTDSIAVLIHLVHTRMKNQPT